MKREKSHWLVERMRRRAAALVMVAAVLSGCITTGRQSSTPQASAPTAEKAGVARLEEGREGFVIREVPQTDGTSRKDFEQSVQLLHSQEYDKAIELLEGVVAKSPGVTAPYINLALAYRAVDKPEEAETHLKKALELVPDHPVACNIYGLLCRESGRFAEARRMYEKAITRFPEYSPLHKNLGILCDLYLHDPVCALNHFEVYSNAWPEDEQVKLWIASLRNRIEKK